MGGAGNDDISGDAGNDLFIFGFESGSDTVSGGSGWSDTIQLEGIDVGPDEGVWTLEVDNGVDWDYTETGIEFDGDASGRIELADGSELIFEDINRIDYG